jgi:polar amino acid transport system substrate-binding protein
MKRSSLFALLGLAAAVPLPRAALADELADIRAAGSLLCGVTGTVTPFGFQDGQTRAIVGYDVDICAAVAKELGVKAELKVVAVESRIPELVQGRVDIIAAQMGYSRERAEQIGYSDTYFVSRVKIIVRADSGAKSIADLAGRKMSAVKGSSPERAMREQIPTAQILTFQDVPSAFLAVGQGKTVGMAASEVILIKLRQQAEVPLEILDKALFLEYWGLGLRKTEPQFAMAVSGALKSLEKSGEFTAIWDRWFGPQTQFPLKREFEVAPIPE